MKPCFSSLFVTACSVGWKFGPPQVACLLLMRRKSHEMQAQGTRRPIKAMENLSVIGHVRKSSLEAVEWRQGRAKSVVRIMAAKVGDDPMPVV